MSTRLRASSSFWLLSCRCSWKVPLFFVFVKNRLLFPKMRGGQNYQRLTWARLMTHLKRGLMGSAQLQSQQTRKSARKYEGWKTTVFLFLKWEGAKITNDSHGPVRWLIWKDALWSIHRCIVNKRANPQGNMKVGKQICGSGTLAFWGLANLWPGDTISFFFLYPGNNAPNICWN